MSDIATPHDRFFKALMDRSAAAGALLRERLPPEIAIRLTDDLPVLMPGSFVDPNMGESHTDRLFRARLRGGGEVLIYVLIEHKSSRDPRVGFQLLKYMVRIWEAVDRDANGQGRLPPIVPLVLYHGTQRWDSPGRFSDMVEADEVLRPYLLDFPFTVTDLGRIPDAAISDEALLRLGLLLLKHVYLETDPRLLLDEDGAAALRADLDFFRTAFRYLMTTQGSLDRSVMLDLVARVFPGEEEAMVSKFAEELLSEGKRLGWVEGVAKGRAEGVVEGEAKVLLTQLRCRFGAVSDPCRQAVLSANADQLEAWCQAIFQAESPEALLGLLKPH